LRLLPSGSEAPAPLAAFASSPPPTELELRRDFPAAARAARAAPGEADADAMSAVQRFLGGLVTLRRGEEVVVGDADAAALATAEARLGEGHLAAAVAALAPLSSPAARAMAPWKTKAEGLLAARRALLALMAS
jgi:hypothetical protein